MILPAYLIFSVFVLLPVFIVAYYSITNFNMYTKPELTGLSNYIALFKDKDYLIDKAYYETLKYFKKIEGNTYYFHSKDRQNTKKL